MLADGGSVFGVGLFVLWLAFLVVVSVAAVAAVGLSVWTLIDAARRPDQQFVLAGVDRTQWIVLASVGLAVCQPVGLVVSVIYLTSIRRRLDAVVWNPAFPPSAGWWPPTGDPRADQPAQSAPSEPPAQSSPPGQPETPAQWERSGGVIGPTEPPTQQ